MARLTVVNRRTPGERRGDWAVRKNGKIVSEGHKSQRKAEQVARQKARKGDRIVVQGVSGQFRKNDRVTQKGGRRGERKRKEGRRGRRRFRAGKAGKDFKFNETEAGKLLKGDRDLV